MRSEDSTDHTEKPDAAGPATRGDVGWDGGKVVGENGPRVATPRVGRPALWGDPPSSNGTALLPFRRRRPRRRTLTHLCESCRTYIPLHPSTLSGWMMDENRHSWSCPICSELEIGLCRRCERYASTTVTGSDARLLVPGGGDGGAATWLFWCERCSGATDEIERDIAVLASRPGEGLV